MSLPDETGSRLEYLLEGTSVQREVYRLLKQYRLFEILEAYDPVLAGTVPLDIQIAGSDLDILCEVHDFAAFEAMVERHFAHLPGFALVRRRVEGIERVKVNFNCGDWPVELFGQPVPTAVQNGYRHMMVEARMLRLYGESFKRRIIKLKQGGLKTEPAFARLLRLEGDPYRELLALENRKDQELLALIEEEIHIESGSNDRSG
ncbi:DUF4269 domain-containing protein [Paenibacillus sp. M1]|uniref:DUF4269 domain-containing protein n=1 Tax=Paenibacillus haidiansis TaxID=1574488 RepID=A0ABU7VNI3_9BACL